MGGSSDLKRSEIKPRSKKRAQFMKDDRVPMIKSLIEMGYGCEIGVILAEVGHDSKCNGQIQGIHERRKRSAGGSLTNRSNLLAACNPCNDYIEDHPEIKDLTGTLLVVREGDPEWHQLGARSDRSD